MSEVIHDSMPYDLIQGQGQGQGHGGPKVAKMADFSLSSVSLHAIKH